LEPEFPVGLPPRKHFRWRDHETTCRRCVKIAASRTLSSHREAAGDAQPMRGSCRGDLGETRASQGHDSPCPAARPARARARPRASAANPPIASGRRDSRFPSRDLGGDLRRGDGCRVAPLLRSKKFRYSGRLGVLRSALSELRGQHRSHGSGSISDAKNASTEVVFDSLSLGGRSASDAANEHPRTRARN